MHLDHIPVIDEAGQRIDYLADIQQAINLGYHSVMVDGSRLPLDENISTGKISVAQDAVYERAVWLIGELLGLAGIQGLVTKGMP